MKGPLTLVLVLAAAIGLGLRYTRLDARPFHTDEAVHAVKFLGLWERGDYRYDPHEYHGPVLYYATLPFVWLSGAETRTQLAESTLRLVPVVFGIGLILVLPMFREGLGRWGVAAAALLTAVSPALVFYSRYYIHEILLVFFTVLCLGAAWRCWRGGGLGWAALAGAGFGLMCATKETWVLVVAALGAGAVGTIVWERVVRSPGGAGAFEAAVQSADRAVPDRGGPRRLMAEWVANARGRLGWGHLVVAAVMAAVVSVVLFTSFFTNAAGPLDSVRTYLPWLQRAGGASPHVHPWFFYFQRLGYFHPASGPVWSEGLILVLALIGWGAALAGRKPADGCLRFVRFIGFYALVLTSVYAALDYKTPWCALGFHHAYILLAGAGVAVLGQLLVRRPWARWGGALVLAGATVHLGIQAWRVAVPYCTDRRNPYVYAQTSKDLLRLVDRVRAIARVYDRAEPLVIKVMAPGGDYWPLPWYLREFSNVGWWSEVTADPYAPMMIVNARFNAELDERSEKKWLMVGMFEHRPTVALELYVAFELWKKYIESLPPPSDDD